MYSISNYLTTHSSYQLVTINSNSSYSSYQFPKKYCYRKTNASPNAGLSNFHFKHSTQGPNHSHPFLFANLICWAHHIFIAPSFFEIELIGRWINSTNDWNSLDCSTFAKYCWVNGCTRFELTWGICIHLLWFFLARSKNRVICQSIPSLG